MTSCSKVEEETDEEDDKQESFIREADKTLATLEALPMHLNWEKILSLPVVMH